MATNDALVAYNKTRAVFIIMITLFIILFVITFLKSLVTQSAMRYPKSIDCEAIEATFSSKDLFMKYAQEDQNSTLVQKGYGYYQCYCKEYSTIQTWLNGIKDDFCYTYQ